MAIMQLCSIKKELEKKKSLTDIVEIIPFENEEIKDFITKENTTNNTPEKEHQNISILQVLKIEKYYFFL